ncbi:hypothetical protein MKW92_018174 [Papaver armeniacum]|nr:hypothetical protein MKW92_018174 [Papaver armeniacum]
MSKRVEDLRSYLQKSKIQAILILKSSCVHLPVEHQHRHLVDRSAFGEAYDTADSVNQWYKLSFEEAFYLTYHLNCLEIKDGGGNCLEANDVWNRMKASRKEFPEFYLAFSNLRKKNWVLRSGSTHCANFLVYRHHPSLVHSEYAAIVDFEESYRLKVYVAL